MILDQAIVKAPYASDGAEATAEASVDCPSLDLASVWQQAHPMEEGGLTTKLLLAVWVFFGSSAQFPQANPYESIPIETQKQRTAALY